MCNVETFEKLIGIEKIDNKMKLRYREAVRAVIIRNEKILLVQSSRGDYKFPGGGVENLEKHKDALIREVAEETGYKSCEVKEKLGLVVERRLDEYEHHTIFEMKSYYYLCDITDMGQYALKLDDYEAALQFTPKWVTINEAIIQNNKIINEVEQNSWVKRENYVLNELKKILK